MLFPWEKLALPSTSGQSQSVPHFSKVLPKEDTQHGGDGGAGGEHSPTPGLKSQQHTNKPVNT